MMDTSSKLIVLPSSVSERLGLYAASQFETGELILKYPGRPIPSVIFNEIVEKCSQWKVKREKNVDRVAKLKTLGLVIEKVKLQNDSFEYSYKKIDLDWSKIPIKWTAIAETISRYSFGVGDVDHLIKNENSFTLMIERITVDGDLIPCNGTDHGYFVNEPLDPLIASEFENLLLQCNQFSVNNINAIPDIEGKSVSLIAKNKIKAGEEILMYYGDMYDRSGRVPMSNSQIAKKKKWFALKFKDIIKFVHNEENNLSIPEKIIVECPSQFMGMKQEPRPLSLAELPSFKRKYTGNVEKPAKKRKLLDGITEWLELSPNPISNHGEWENPGIKKPVIESKYKTSMCKRWLTGSCAYGGACKFSHGKDEMRCFSFHVYGQCRYGNQCTLIH